MASCISPQYSAAFLRHRGFNLIELRMAVAIMVIVLAVPVMAFTSIKTANDPTNAGNGMVGTLERARTIQDIIVGWYRTTL
jgi:prepilin-type N-terminal cleavage/methylation domain-containing protein